MKISKIKKIKNNKKGSALLVVIMIFFAIFILAFGSGYLVFINISNTSDFSDSLRAYYAAKAGVERAQFEAIKNNFSFSDNCSNDIFSDSLNNGSTYYINCENGDDGLEFFSLGVYKNNKVALKIDCIDINKECSNSCLSGSLCGGGKLLKHKDKTNEFNIVISPSGCNEEANYCDNGFLLDDIISLPWENPDSDSLYGALSEDDGRENIDILDPQNNTQFESAKYCDDLVVNGYSNWYLPASVELSSLISTLPYFNFLMNEGNHYWTSSEYQLDPESPVNARFLDSFNNIIGFTDERDSNYLIRCIRRYE